MLLTAHILLVLVLNGLGLYLLTPLHAYVGMSWGYLYLYFHE
jgi:hypothetical protein